MEHLEVRVRVRVRVRFWSTSRFCSKYERKPHDVAATAGQRTSAMHQAMIVIRKIPALTLSA